MKLGFLYQAQYDAGSADTPFRLQYRDNNFPGRAGWQEIIAGAGPGVSLCRVRCQSEIGVGP